MSEKRLPWETVEINLFEMAETAEHGPTIRAERQVVHDEVVVAQREAAQAIAAGAA